MSNPRWCQACGKVEDFDDRWFELWIDGEGTCRVKPVTDSGTYHMQFRSDIFACGQLPALVLVERYLHNRSFDLPVSEPATH